MTADIVPYHDPTLPVAERVADLLERMTLEEKVAQLICFGRAVEMTESAVDSAANPLEEVTGGALMNPERKVIFDADGNVLCERMRALFQHGVGQIGRPAQARSARGAAELTNTLQRYLAEETRLGVPALFNEEGLHGLMAEGSTSFPQAIALGSTWDVDLVEAVYAAVAKETRVRGSNYVYTPVLDLARDPRWGRVEETFGEDPYLVSRMGVAAVRGLQGEGPSIDADRVIACAKHYAVHGQPEGGLNAAPGNISERVIREEFLLPFEATVKEANVQAIMASYNEIDGVPAHVNRWLLQDVLYDEWGYDGFVTSDGFGVPQLIRLHHVAAGLADAAKQALEAGIDCEVPEGLCYSTLVEQARAGDVSMDAIDRATAHILRAKVRLGLLDETPYVDPEEAERVTNCEAHQKLALQAAREAAVLLKNADALLPLDVDAVESLAVIGPNAADLHIGGYAMDPQRGMSVLEGLRTYVGEQAQVHYAEGCRITEGAQGYAAWHEDAVQRSDPVDDDARIAEAVALAEQSDAAVLVLGGNESTCREGWWFNHLGDRADLTLLGRQDELVEAVVATGTPTVVVLINGRPLNVTGVAQKVPAMLECWYLGQATGTAVAEILFGDVNPSGKLPVSFPRSVGQLPVYYYHRPSAKRGYLFTPTEPLFPFGFGLSYTTFDYGAVRVTPETITPDGAVTVTVDVTNIGECAGDEVVQLYVRDLVSSVTRPVQLLRDFQRVHLAPGETKTVVFTLRAEKLAFLDREMQWGVEPGAFEVLVGGSSAETKTASFAVVAE